jgi:hypothetical protein
MRSPPPSTTFATRTQSRTEDDAVVGAGWTVTVTLGGTSKWDHAFPAFPEISTEFLIDEQMRTQIFDMEMTPRVSNSLSLPNNTIEFKTPQGKDVMVSIGLPRSAEEMPACEMVVRGRGYATVSPKDHEVWRRLILSAYRLYARHYEVEAQHPSWWPSGYCAADALDGRIVDCVSTVPPTVPPPPLPPPPPPQH